MEEPLTSMGEKILVIGGSNGATDVSDVWEYDPAVNSWSSKESMLMRTAVGVESPCIMTRYWVMGAESRV